MPAINSISLRSTEEAHAPTNVNASKTVPVFATIVAMSLIETLQSIQATMRRGNASSDPGQHTVLTPGKTINGNTSSQNTIP